jgi:UDP-N-acetylmuramoyl-tripeptide--D-alanyl-D-alanine ligase
MCLQQLATYHRKQFTIPFLAITGSNGKTTTKELITSVLKTSFKTVATIGNLNNHIGVPLTILSIPTDAEMAIIEMGANHQKEIASYCEIALPNFGLINNCGKAHIEGFGGEEGVRKGKGELYDFLIANNGTIFLNTDLPYLVEMSAASNHKITYGTHDAHYVAKPIMQDAFIGAAILNRDAETAIHSNLVGAYNFPNILAAVCIGLHFGIKIDTIKEAIENYHPDNSRSQLTKKGSNTIILDAYNANPSSMKVALENFAAMPNEHKLVWLGAMKEMGADAQKEHQQLIALLNAHSWEQVILVGKEFESTTHSYLWFENTALAVEYINKQVFEHKTILIKGSRASKMELLFEAISAC